MGECLGYISLYFQKVFGLTYPIVGCQYAYQMLTFPNKHTEVLTQVKGHAGIEKGDVVIWGTGLIPVTGHIGIYETGDANGFTALEQNWQYHKVTEEYHTWNGVIGYIKVKKEAPMPDLNDPWTFINQHRDKIYLLGQADIAINNQLKVMNTNIANLTKALGENNAIDATQATQLVKALKDSQDALNRPTGGSTLSTDDAESVSWLTNVLKAIFRR
jgi:hypothetical protein